MATNFPPGTKVSIPAKGITGVTASEPGLTPTGWVVSVDYDAEFAHLSPVGGADYGVEELEIITEEATEEAPTGRPAGRARREALGQASVSGWELLYDKPKQGCEVGRRFIDGKPEYALICKEHSHVHKLPRLTSERTTRTNGGWCPSC